MKKYTLTEIVTAIGGIIMYGYPLLMMSFIRDWFHGVERVVLFLISIFVFAYSIYIHADRTKLKDANQGLKSCLKRNGVDENEWWQY